MREVCIDIPQHPRNRNQTALPARACGGRLPELQGHLRLLPLALHRAPAGPAWQQRGWGLRKRRAILRLGEPPSTSFGEILDLFFFNCFLFQDFQIFWVLFLAAPWFLTGSYKRVSGLGPGAREVNPPALRRTCHFFNSCSFMLVFLRVCVLTFPWFWRVLSGAPNSRHS